ncbi:hypothetical protein [Actinoallomurus sp. NPDC050550]|uniref:hypothetical protein n=1 Tax=Actinoallomurus sp. NPDC050550 TaxID=3154937 RepID=UPI0033E24BB1
MPRLPITSRRFCAGLALAATSVLACPPIAHATPAPTRPITLRGDSADSYCEPRDHYFVYFMAAAYLKYIESHTGGSNGNPHLYRTYDETISHTTMGPTGQPQWHSDPTQRVVHDCGPS